MAYKSHAILNSHKAVSLNCPEELGRTCHEDPQRTVWVPQNREEGITSKGEGHDLLEVGGCRGRTVYNFSLVNIFLCEILDGRMRLVPVFDDPWEGRDSA